jgi:NitT/TauT family transport system substrate-binding protein
VAIAAKVSKQPPQAFEEWLYTKADYYRDPDFLPNLDALQSNMDMQQKLGFLEHKLDVNRYADLAIVKEAAQRLK